MFNLGLMHEHGIGLPKDLHLAKRYYDMVLSTDAKASIPIRLALWKLGAHGWLLQHEGEILR
jgi:SEL1 protein